MLLGLFLIWVLQAGASFGMKRNRVEEVDRRSAVKRRLVLPQEDVEGGPEEDDDMARQVALERFLRHPSEVMSLQKAALFTALDYDLNHWHQVMKELGVNEDFFLDLREAFFEHNQPSMSHFFRYTIRKSELAANESAYLQRLFLTTFGIPLEMYSMMAVSLANANVLRAIFQAPAAKQVDLLREAFASTPTLYMDRRLFEDHLEAIRRLPEDVLRYLIFPRLFLAPEERNEVTFSQLEDAGCPPVLLEMLRGLPDPSTPPLWLHD